MKNIFLLLLLCVLFTESQAQKLSIQGDSAVILEEKGQKIIIDSALIEKQIFRAKKEVEGYDNLILQAKAAKSDKQSTLTYFLEIRNKYWALKRSIKNKKG